jgi:TM2 domain-containing membrane protein YozV/ribosomal protein L40E
MTESSAAASVHEKFCRDCGAILNARAEICPKCGVRQLPPPSGFSGTAPNGKSRLAAALFALLLGGIGVHKFYLGQIGRGVLYLCFFWTGIPFLIGIVEGILLLVMSDEEFARKHGNG